MEQSEDEDDEHMSCRNSADEDVNMQELLEQETAEDIIEDVTALIRGKKTPKDVLCFGKNSSTRGSVCCIHISKLTVSGKIISYDDKGATVSST
jgi:hypothetical protein